MLQKKKKAVKDNRERWLLTYSDLMNLLMILFILLYAMSNISEEKYEQLAQSLNHTFGGDSILNGSDGVLPGGTVPKNPLASESPEDIDDDGSQGSTVKTIRSAKDMENLKTDIDKILEEYHAGNSIGSSLNDEGLVLFFQDNIFFDSGQDTLKSEMENGLDKIAGLLNKIDNSILVEGYTDNIPIQNSRFSSNWQLSSIRAANVAQYLEDYGKIDSSRLSAIGYGKNHPIASNDTESGRSQNRRINLVILYDTE